MSQAIAPTGAVRVPPQAAGDTPELVFVLRHYRWLIIIGALAGLLLGTVLFFTLRKLMPRYTASAWFQVLPTAPVDPIRTDNNLQTAMSVEDVARVVKRQEKTVKSDPVLDAALKTNAFQQDYRNPASGAKSAWLQEYYAQPKLKLRKAVQVYPEAGADVFAISMTGADPQEMASLVNAVADTYFQELKNQQATDDTKAINDLNEMKMKLETTIKQKEAELNDFRTIHDIPAMTRQSEVSTQDLALLGAELGKAESDNQAAQSQLKITQQQQQSQTLTLTPDLEMYIENDPTIKYLEQQKLALKQEMAVSLMQFSEEHKVIKTLQTRIAEIDRQAEEIRAKMRGPARSRMLDSAQTMAQSATAHLQDVQERFQRKDRELKDLDRWLVDYHSRELDLNNQRDVLKQVNERWMVESMKPASDVRRVRWFLRATAPDLSEISFPLWWQFGPGGLMIGLGLSFGAAYLLELLNTRVRTPRDITRTMQLPLLGFVPDQEDDTFADGDLATSVRTSPGSMIAESFRQIRGRLAAKSNGQPLTSLLVASASPGGGATMVASNLANGIALNDLRVLLVDVNFYRPGLKNCYRNLPDVGISDVLAGAATLEAAIAKSPELPALSVMGVGSRPATTASELLESKAFRDLLAQIKSRYDVVVFDGAPMNLVSDSIRLAAKVDGVIAVVRAGTISRGTVGRVRDQLRGVRANLLGIVLNAAKTHGSGYFKENYRTYYQYAGPRTAPRLGAPTAN